MYFFECCAQDLDIIQIRIGEFWTVFFDRLWHGDAIKRFGEIDLVFAVSKRSFAQYVGAYRAKHFFREIHQVMIIAPCDVELHHREFRIVANRNALVAEAAVNLEYAFETADDKTF